MQAKPPHPRRVFLQQRCVTGAAQRLGIPTRRHVHPGFPRVTTEASEKLFEGIDAPICQDSRSRSQVCGLARSVVCHHALKDLAGEKACETADDLPFGPPFSGASFDVVERW